MTKIVINETTWSYEQPYITYAEVAELAGYHGMTPFISYRCKLKDGLYYRGVMDPATPVKIVSEMVFHVTTTGDA